MDRLTLIEAPPGLSLKMFIYPQVLSIRLQYSNHEVSATIKLCKNIFLCINMHNKYQNYLSLTNSQTFSLFLRLKSGHKCPSVTRKILLFSRQKLAETGS